MQKSLALAALVALMLSAFPSPSEAQSFVFGSDEYDREIARLIDVERERHGLAPMPYIADNSVAERSNREYGATGQPHPIMDEVGAYYNQGLRIHLNDATENHARAEVSVAPSVLVDGWMNSPGHRNNILSARRTHLTVSTDIVDGRYFAATHHVAVRYPEFLPGVWTPTLGDDGRPSIVDIRDMYGRCLELEAATNFTDISARLFDPVHCLTDFGITRGTQRGLYEPNKDVTRQVMATFVVRAMEVGWYEFAPVTDPPFPDVDINSAHGANVVRLANAGVIDGYADGNFGPDRPVSRAAMTKFLVNAYEATIGLRRPDAAYDWFDDDDGSTLESYINRAVEAGWVAGHEDGTFRGGETVNRGQMAQFLSRWFVMTDNHSRAVR